MKVFQAFNLFRYFFRRFYLMSGERGTFSAAGYFLRSAFDRADNFMLERASFARESVKRGKKQESARGLLTYSEFRKVKKLDSYYRARWSYFSAALDIIKKEPHGKVLELGPRSAPLVKGSDIMDIYRHGPRITYIHDAKNTPWPQRDKEYDMFIGLQVWEHLGDRQKDAFKEVMRIARSAVISFPYKRYSPEDCHHNIDEHIINEWTLGLMPERVVKRGPVIVYFFRFG
ncbi:MAG: hypothetical protein ABH883_01425 [Candidatus Omnitrophota bacterium]